MFRNYFTILELSNAVRTEKNTYQSPSLKSLLTTRGFDHGEKGHRYTLIEIYNDNQQEQST
jgi:hypothetical protein